jgi:putative transposase
VSKDHAHLFVSIPPRATISRLAPNLKGKTAYKMPREFPHLNKKFWGRRAGARGSFVCGGGNVTDEAIKAYIENQSHDLDDDFKVEGVEPPSS